MGNSQMNNGEREIDLKLLFAYIFKQWRRILFITLVCGLLGAGYSSLKIIPTYNSLQDAYNNNMSAHAVSMKTAEEQKEKTQAVIDQLTEYSQKSIKANIDPYSEAQTITNISIVTSKGQDDFEALLSGTNHANQITQAYASCIKKEINYAEIIDKFGISDQLLKELISVEPNYDTDTITVTAIGNSEDITKEIMDYILLQTGGNESKIKSEYGDYSAVVSTPSTNIVTDSSLVTPVSAQMLSSNSVMNDTLSKINTLKTSLSTISASTVAEPVAVNVTIEKSIVKYLILGLVLGAFSSIVILAIFVALSGKLYSEEDVKLMFNEKILAVIPAKVNDKRNTKFDRYLGKILDSSYNISEDVALEKAAVNIEACKEDFKKLMLINVKANRDIEYLKNRLQSLDKNANLNTSTDINANGVELKRLKDSDGIILVMERNRTKINDISSIIEIANNWEKPIIGCIVL